MRLRNVMHLFLQHYHTYIFDSRISVISTVLRGIDFSVTCNRKIKCNRKISRFDFHNIKSSVFDITQLSDGY